jgi:hypothetical protein
MVRGDNGGVDMVEIITCPACQRKLQLAGASWDQSVQCPQCAHTFVAAPAPFVTPTKLAPTPKLLNAGDEIDIERRLAPHDYAPHRGPMIKALGLIGLVGGMVFLFPLVVGPFAWLLGSRDLRAMRDGHMDPKGRKQTRLGWFCGIAASMMLLMLGLAFLGLFLSI